MLLNLNRDNKPEQDGADTVEPADDMSSETEGKDEPVVETGKYDDLVIAGLGHGDAAMKGAVKMPQIQQPQPAATGIVETLVDDMEEPEPVSDREAPKTFDEILSDMSPVAEDDFDLSTDDGVVVGGNTESVPEASEAELLETVLPEEIAVPIPEPAEETVAKTEYDALNARHEQFLVDWENYKRRTEETVEAAKLNANINMAKALMPALDDFVRAIAHADALAAETPSIGEISNGMKAINRKLLTALANEGFSVILPEPGDKFDMDKHQAIEMRPAADGTVPDTIAEVVQVGYEMNGKILRPAMVAVFG